MTEENQRWCRLGLLSALVEQSRVKLGRTVLMKLAYLLQTVKGVPLGYDFRLYTYGPFDSDVLTDLGFAESLGAVKSELVTFTSGPGYGYEFTRGTPGDFVRQKTSDALSSHNSAIEWALQEFGDKSAAELELLTTIIYADREAKARRGQLSEGELARMVEEVKPRFTEQYIVEKIEELKGKQLLVALSQAEQAP